MNGNGGRCSGGGRGVSEVIGVVLLVAIVVVLAGTVAYVMTGVGGETEPVPQFAKVEDYNRSTDGLGQAFAVKHGSGEVVETARLRLVVNDAVVRDRSSDAYVDHADVDENISEQVGDRWRVGQWLVIDQSTMRTGGGDIASDPNQYLDLRAAEIRIVWLSKTEETSETLYRWEGPET